MNLKNKIAEFNQRWDIQEEKTYEEEFGMFKTRVLNILINIDQHLPSDQKLLFCQFFALWDGTKVFDTLAKETNERKFYRILEVIFDLKIQTLSSSRGVLYSKEILLSLLRQAIDFSKVNLTFVENDNGEVIFYPKGEYLLDVELVNSVLSFLSGSDHDHFVDALHFYQDRIAIKSAESLRRAIEEFLRIQLKNQVGLKENISEIKNRFKEDGRPAQAKNIICYVLTCLDQFFNDESKHNDGDLNEGDNEFLIYQVALLLRYLSKSL